MNIETVVLMSRVGNRVFKIPINKGFPDITFSLRNFAGDTKARELLFFSSSKHINCPESDRVKTLYFTFAVQSILKV